MNEDEDMLRALRNLEWPGPKAAEIIEYLRNDYAQKLADCDKLAASIRQMHITIDSRDAVIRELEREIDRLLAALPDGTPVCD